MKITKKHAIGDYSMIIDVYSDSVCSIYERTKKDVESFSDAELLLNYRLIAQARTHALSDNAKKVVEELDMILETEVLSRMGRWSVQANNFAQVIYDKITACR